MVRGCVDTDPWYVNMAEALYETVVASAIPFLIVTAVLCVILKIIPQSKGRGSKWILNRAVIISVIAVLPFVFVYTQLLVTTFGC